MSPMCMVFYCKDRHGRYCCADCPEPCGNHCLNHPDRCNLSQVRSPHISEGETRQRLTDAQKEALYRLLSEGLMPQKTIAELVGVSNATVSWYKLKLQREVDRNGG